MRVVVAAALLFAAAAFAGDWQHVKGDQFEIDLPGEPQVDSDTSDTDVGKVTNTMQKVEVGKALYALSYADYPADFAKRAAPAKALEGARDGAVANIKATLATDAAITIESGSPKKKWPGRDFTATTPEGIKYAARLILVGSRLYQLVAVGEDGYDQSTLERMKSSFKLVAKKKDAR